MKNLFSILLGCLLYLPAEAQSNKKPVNVLNAPSVFHTRVDPYYNYADQGNASYINNSQFYNQGNHFSNSFPSGNGFYPQPGNSNPVNHEMNSRSPMEPTTIFNGDIPIRLSPYPEETNTLLRP